MLPFYGVEKMQTLLELGDGSQALPTHSGEYDDYSGESGGLLEGGVRKPEIYYSYRILRTIVPLIL